MGGARRRNGDLGGGRLEKKAVEPDLAKIAVDGAMDLHSSNRLGIVPGRDKTAGETDGHHGAAPVADGRNARVDNEDDSSHFIP